MAAARTLIGNIGQIVTGDIARPLADGDSIAIEDGRIAAVGRGLDGDADTVIDARGSTVIPGLIDSHCHPVFGDFTPRQRTIDFIDRPRRSTPRPWPTSIRCSAGWRSTRAPGCRTRRRHRRWSGATGRRPSASWATTVAAPGR